MWILHHMGQSRWPSKKIFLLNIQFKLLPRLRLIFLCLHAAVRCSYVCPFYLMFCSALFIALFLKTKSAWDELNHSTSRSNEENACGESLNLTKNPLNMQEQKKKIHICIVTVFLQQFSLKAFAFNRVQRIHRHLFLIRLTTCAARRFKIQTSFSTRHYTIRWEKKKKNIPSVFRGLCYFSPKPAKSGASLRLCAGRKKKPLYCIQPPWLFSGPLSIL